MRLQLPTGFDGRAFHARIGHDRWAVVGDEIDVPDGDPITQADVDACVTPPAEIAAAARREELSRTAIRDLALVLREVVTIAWPQLDAEARDRCREARDRVAEYLTATQDGA